MIDLSNELAGLCRAYEQIAARQNGVVLQFMGAHDGVGVSTCARAFARLMAPRLRRGVWLMDLDFYANTQYHALSNARAQALYGATGSACDPSLGNAPLFWRVHPALVRKGGGKAGDQFYLKMHRIGAHALYVSRFHHELLREGQQVQFRPAPTYWKKVRAKIDLAIIDSPPLSRGKGGLLSAADADGVVIIVHPDQADAPIMHLRRQIEGRGGQCLGVIYNAVPETMPQQREAQ